MGMAVRDEGKKVNSNINVTPMVDVMLVLVIIFMVVTPMLSQKVTVDLPKVTAAVLMENASKQDAITVAITRDGKTFLGGDQVSLDALGSKIADVEAGKTDPAADKSVYLRADTRANYGKVMEWVEEAAAAYLRISTLRH
jgi:biopolymer transport protein TolR